MRITLPNPKRFSKVFKNATNMSFTNTILGVSIDSRQCVEGDLYIAIKGENVDGNQFIKDAQEAGAIAALIAKSDNTVSDLQQIEVNSPVKTIGEVANAWRKRFKIPVIGITGSNNAFRGKRIRTEGG